MKPRKLSLALAVGCALAMSAVAQTTIDTQSKAGTMTSSSSTTTSRPTAATSVTTTTTPSQSITTTTDMTGPSASTSSSVTGATTRIDTVLVPGAVVVAPGVTVLDSTTSATVGSAASTSDRELLDALVSALSSDPALRGAHLNVTVSGDLVRITGTATDTAQADRARSVAAGVAGNARVEADIATG